jgi:hypothetical protein
MYLIIYSLITKIKLKLVRNQQKIVNVVSLYRKCIYEEQTFICSEYTYVPTLIVITENSVFVFDRLNHGVIFKESTYYNLYTEWLQKLESFFFILPRDVAVFTKKLRNKKIYSYLIKW